MLHVGAVDGPDQLQLDVRQVGEQPPPPPEQHRHHGELQRVEQARPQALLGGRGPVQQDVAIARGGLASARPDAMSVT